MADLIKYPDDPTATYRGYRRQALYCLYRLFDDGLPDNCVLQPEGHEDLAILSPNGELLEVVQVKDYTNSLTASSFKSSFYNRISKFCSADSAVAVKLVSYGPVGPELGQALDNEQATPVRALTTLTNYLDDSDSKEKTDSGADSKAELAQNIFRHVNLLSVDEETLTADVVSKLKATITSADPQSAFENLMWWLIWSAEKKSKLTRAGTIKKLQQIGQFIDDRAIHEHEWNVSIKPIKHPVVDQSDEEKLRREFFQGGRVTAEHIASNIDVRRIEELNEIHKSFQKEDVVILRAASGQGKTTLAYRYLLDWTPNDFRFEVLQAADLQHARRMSVAIAGHVEILDVPTVVYVDVRPGDTLWVEFVRELTTTSGLRVLVTIREEDWFRARVTDDDFRCVELNLTFDEMKGRELYDALRAVGYGDSYLDFNDAWSKLGERQTLFEFVYLMTQNERLAQRIEEQISTLQDEVNRGEVSKGDLQKAELHLLRLVAIASSYEARLDLKRLASHVGIPEITRTLERFRNEYLLRTTNEGRNVEGFHAIRSEIIAAKLSDEVLQPRGDLEAEVVPLVVEDDLETFLLCSFSRNPESAERVSEVTQQVPLDTWSGIRGAMVALMWLGLKEYADENADLIDDVRKSDRGGWWIALDWDLAQIAGQNNLGPIQSLAKISTQFADAAIRAELARERQSDKTKVFSRAREFLCSLVAPDEFIDTFRQFMSTAEVLFWIGHLGITNHSISKSIDLVLVTRALRVLDLQSFSEFACSIRLSCPEVYASWLKKKRNSLEAFIRSEASIIALEEDESLLSHFIIDLNLEASELRTAKVRATINDLAVERVKIVSRCIPGFEKYGTLGYGHRTIVFGEEADDSCKLMPVKNIMTPWLPAFNGLAHGLVELRFRPNSWDDYIQQIRRCRQNVVMALRDLRSAITNSRGETPIIGKYQLWQECMAQLSEEFLLPIGSVDEWGFVTESTDTGYQFGSNLDLSRMTAQKGYHVLDTANPFLKALRKYKDTVLEFMDKSIHCIVRLHDRIELTCDGLKKSPINYLSKANDDISLIDRSIYIGVEACNAVRNLHHEECDFSGKTDIVLFEDQTRGQEIYEFESTIRTWCAYWFPDQTSPKPKTVKTRQKRIRQRPKKLRDCLTPVFNRMRAELFRLKKSSINASIVSEKIRWSQETALWISFDVSHPSQILIALEQILSSLNNSFRSERDKIVRMKSMTYFWTKFVLIPLVRGRSLDKQAYPEMSGVVHLVDEDLSTQWWRFIPSPIPEDAWDALNLKCWEPHHSWTLFDECVAAYTALFHHVTHMADFDRCSVDLDELGEDILQNYLLKERKRANPLLQATFDSFAQLLNVLTSKDHVAPETPDMMNCLALLVEMKDCIFPIENFAQHATLTIEQIVGWRDRLQTGFASLDEARSFLIADSLGIEAID